MTVSDTHRVYRSLLHLYPGAFRDHYGDDLVQHLDDLVADRGVRAAWARTSVDLVVTVPRYRLESIMSEQRSTATLSTIIAVLAVLGVLSILTGVYPGVLLLFGALVLAYSQRAPLARALRAPSSSTRRRRLSAAAVLAVVVVLSMVSYLVDLDDGAISGFSLIAHNAIGVPAMLGAIVLLVAGLLTPKTPEDDRRTPSLA